MPCHRLSGDLQIHMTDMVAVLRTQPDIGSTFQPEPPLLLLFHWYFKPLTPPQTLHTFVIHLPDSVSTGQQLGDNHIGRTDVAARSCQRSGVLLQHGFAATAAMWMDAGPEHGKHVAQILSSCYARDQCRRVDAKGSEVSGCGLLQDQLVQRQIRNRTP